MTSPEALAQFIASMPPTYSAAFGANDAEEHARIVYERGREPGRAVVWRFLPQGVAIMCVVTDDKPGLVALVSSAFLAHALDVRAAQIYCRTCADGRTEAVDFFWLRGLPGGMPMDEARLEACARTIRELLSADAARAADITDAPPPGGDAAASVTITRESALHDIWEVVLVARDFHGLLHTVARLLHQHGLEVVRCEIRTEGGMARDRFFVTAYNGQPAEPQLTLFRGSLLGVISAMRDG
jgi:UTP:GlnB (protein PII) uridylyltransferase